MYKIYQLLLIMSHILLSLATEHKYGTVVLPINTNKKDEPEHKRFRVFYNGKPLSQFWKDYIFSGNVWCIGEYISKTCAYMFYEDNDGIKELIWNQDQNAYEIIEVQSTQLLMKLYCIRTLNTDICLEQFEKYKILNEPCCFYFKSCLNGGRYFLPNELVYNIFIYIDLYTLMAILPLVNKDFNKLSPSFSKKNFENISKVYTDVVYHILKSICQDENQKVVLPCSALSDKRFSLSKDKQSELETLYANSIKIENGYMGHVEGRHVESTLEEVREFLSVYFRSSDQVESTLEKIKIMRAKQVSKKEAERCLSLVIYNLHEQWRDVKLAEEYFLESIKENIMYFEDIWQRFIDQIIKHQKKDFFTNNNSNIVGDFYKRPLVLSALLELLHNDLEKKQISLDHEQITYFLIHVQQVINILSLKKDLEENESKLIALYEKVNVFLDTLKNVTEQTIDNQIPPNVPTDESLLPQSNNNFDCGSKDSSNNKEAECSDLNNEAKKPIVAKFYRNHIIGGLLGIILFYIAYVKIKAKTNLLHQL